MEALQQISEIILSLLGSLCALIFFSNTIRIALINVKMIACFKLKE